VVGSGACNPRRYQMMDVMAVSIGVRRSLLVGSVKIVVDAVDELPMRM
jgi:hypothetical protein